MCLQTHSETDMTSEKRVVDSVGERADRAMWGFCGAIPLVEIEKGRRACREGWRDRGEGMDMLHTAVCGSGKSAYVMIQHENEDYVEASVSDPLSIRDLLAEDWYVEEVSASSPSLLQVPTTSGHEGNISASITVPAAPPEETAALMREIASTEVKVSDDHHDHAHPWLD